MIRPRTKQNGLPENVRQKNGAWHVRYTEMIDGERKWREKKLCRVEKGKEALHLALAEFYGQGSRIRVPNMPTIIAEYCKHYFPTLKPDTQREYQRQYAKIAKAFADFDIDVPQKRDCIEFLELHCKPRSRIMQVYRDRLVSLFRWSSDRGYRQDNPALDIALKGPPKNNRYCTDTEYHAIRDALMIGTDGRATPSGPMLQCFMDMLYLTFQRPTDIRLLRWSQVRDGVIDFLPSKTAASSGGQVKIPVTTAIAAVLERVRNAGIVKGMSYVIHQGNGTAYTRYGIGSAWSRACARAGVKGVTTRHLRPKATTDASRQGYTIAELQTTLVHASAGTTESYVKQIDVPLSEVKLGLPKRAK